MSHQNETQNQTDANDLQKFGYVQELLRDMGGFSSFALSFSVISILTCITQLYGYGLQHGGPMQATLGWIVVSIMTFTVALAMAELASAYPTAGALYHWSHFLGGRTLGWFTACFNTVGQFAIVAGVDYGLAHFLIGVLKWPDTPSLTTGVYDGILFSHAILNHVGIRVVNWLNHFSAWYHIGVVLLVLVSLASVGFVQPISFLFHFESTDSFPKIYSLMIGLLLAQWTLTGYDASAHTAEETKNPRKNAPWGIFIAVAISAIVGLLLLISVTLSIPDLKMITAAGDDAFAVIFRNRLGESMGTLMLLLFAGAMWLCGLASLTSASRMVYAFARDGGLPFSKIWARVSPNFRVPVFSIWGIVGLALILVVSIDLYSAVVSMATIALYVSYGLPILARVWVRVKNPTKDIQGPWSLGRLSTLNACIALTWIGFITVIFVLPPNTQSGKMILGCFIFFILNWYCVARHRFVGPKVKILS